MPLPRIVMRPISRLVPGSPSRTTRILPFALAVTFACRGPESIETPPAGEHPAVALERAKAEAREGAIEETYAE